MNALIVKVAQAAFEIATAAQLEIFPPKPHLEKRFYDAPLTVRLMGKTATFNGFEQIRPEIRPEQERQENTFDTTHISNYLDDVAKNTAGNATDFFRSFVRKVWEAAHDGTKYITLQLIAEPPKESYGNMVKRRRHVWSVIDGRENVGVEDQTVYFGMLKEKKTVEGLKAYLRSVFLTYMPRPLTAEFYMTNNDLTDDNLLRIMDEKGNKFLEGDIDLQPKTKYILYGQLLDPSR